MSTISFVSYQLNEQEYKFMDEEIDLQKGIKKVLTKRDQSVLQMRLDGFTYQEIGEKINRSLERARRIVVDSCRNLAKRGYISDAVFQLLRERWYDSLSPEQKKIYEEL
jgi:DNA-directed RNA polymerase sigma subunit (sigma70/sigma32)